MLLWCKLRAVSCLGVSFISTSPVIRSISGVASTPATSRRPLPRNVRLNVSQKLIPKLNRWVRPGNPSRHLLPNPQVRIWLLLLGFHNRWPFVRILRLAFLSAAIVSRYLYLPTRWRYALEQVRTPSFVVLGSYEGRFIWPWVLLPERVRTPGYPGLV